MIRFLNGLSFVLFIVGIILIAGGCEAMNLMGICTGGVALLLAVLLSCAIDAIETKRAYDERDEYDQK